MADNQKIRARVETTRKILIHNDLSQAATYFSETVDAKLKAGNRDAIMFDGMACALMVAFAFEANLNFMGDYLSKEERLKEWTERQAFSKKLKKVFGALEISLDMESRPLSSMMKMKGLRDTLAHGKPQVIEEKKEMEATQAELEKGLKLAADWERLCRSESVTEALSDLDDLWKLMIQKSGVSVIDTFSSGSGSISRITS